MTKKEGDRLAWREQLAQRLIYGVLRFLKVEDPHKLFSQPREVAVVEKKSFSTDYQLDIFPRELKARVTYQDKVIELSFAFSEALDLLQTLFSAESEIDLAKLNSNVLIAMEILKNTNAYKWFILESYEFASVVFESDIVITKEKCEKAKLVKKYDDKRDYKEALQIFLPKVSIFFATDNVYLTVSKDKMRSNFHLYDAMGKEVKFELPFSAMLVYKFAIEGVVSDDINQRQVPILSGIEVIDLLLFQVSINNKSYKPSVSLLQFPHEFKNSLKRNYNFEVGHLPMLLRVCVFEINKKFAELGITSRFQLSNLAEISTDESDAQTVVKVLSECSLTMVET